MPLDLAAGFLFSRPLFLAMDQIRSTRGGVREPAQPAAGGEAALTQSVARALRRMTFDARKVEMRRRCKMASID
jgi:hypothetical protein